MAELDQEQKILFAKFKEAVRDCKLIDSSDEYLVKWLVARNFNLDQAEKMLRNNLEWRRLNKVDDILDTFQPPEVIKKYFSIGKIGTDKFGCPTYMSAQGRMDIRGLLQSVTRRDYMRYQIYLSEMIGRDMRSDNERTGSKNTFVTFIGDMDQLSMRQMGYKPAMDCGVEQTKIFEAHYPENLRRIFVINAPKIFSIMYGIMKAFLHPSTVAKLRIFGYDKEEWQAALLEEIDADQLPACYGGTMTDPDGDPMCPSKLCMGGEIPAEYYLSQDPPEPKEYMESMSIIAGVGGRKKFSFKVDVVNSVLRWEFMTEGGDIAYRVYFKSAEGVVEDLVPHGRVDSHLFIEEGQIICESVGKYVVDFDNTFSIVKPKKVRYFITVDPPSASPLAALH